MPVPENPQQLNGPVVDSLTGLVEDYVTAGLNDFLYATTDLPEFLADPNPVTAPALPLKEITRAACRSYARGGGPQNLPGFAGAWGSICEPYLDSIGENPEDGSLGIPFAGGQCTGTNYRVNGTATIFPNPDCVPTTNNYSATHAGPIRGFRTIKSTTFPSNPCVKAGNRVIMTHGPDNNIQEVTVAGATYGARFSVTSIVRVSGNADTCGNPAPVYDPPKGKPGLPPVPPQPIRFPGIGPVNTTVNFNNNGDLVVNLPDVGVSVEVPDPFGGGEPTGGGEGGPPPGDVGSPGAGGDAGAGDDVEGEAPAGRVLTGVRVQLLTVPQERKKYTNEVYRGAYYVYMGVPGLLDHDPAGAMVTADQFIFAEKDNLTAWRVRANTGYTIRVTPYYREVEV